MSLYRRVRYRAGRSELRVPRVWFQHRGLRPHDVFLASYPRSGSTWLRLMLYEALTGQSAEFDNINDLIPDVPRHRVAPEILPNGGRLVKTHEAFRKDYKKAVYIVRDVRDIVLSQYARETELSMLDGLYESFDDYLPSFMQGKTTGFGPWHRHVQSWLESPAAEKENLLVVHFQDLRANTEGLLVQIAEFLGVRPDLKRIQDAITNNSLEKMRVKENRAQKLHKSIGEEGRFVRKGAIQGWRQKLTEAQVQLIEQYAGTELARLGYQTSSPNETPGLAEMQGRAIGQRG